MEIKRGYFKGDIDITELITTKKENREEIFKEIDKIIEKENNEYFEETLPLEVSKNGIFPDEGKCEYLEKIMKIQEDRARKEIEKDQEIEAKNPIPPVKNVERTLCRIDAEKEKADKLIEKITNEDM